MIKRILTGWNFTRVIFLIIGLWMGIQAGLNGEWVGMVIGTYLGSMGLFAFGCARGNCFNGSCSTEPDQDHTK